MNRQTGEIPDFEVRVTDRHGRSAACWGRGARVRLDPDAYTPAREIETPAWGTARVTGADPDEALALSRDGQVEFEFGLGGGHDSAPGRRLRQLSSVARMLEPRFGGLSHALADALVSPVPGPVASQPPHVGPPLEAWFATELWLLTSISPHAVPDRVPHALRPVRMLSCPQALLVAWHPLRANDAWWDLEHPVEPVPVDHRRHSMLVEVTEHSGTAAAARLVQDVMQHHDWTRWQLTQRVESWESRFFEQARTGELFDDFDELALANSLGEVHEFLALLRRVTVDTLRRGRLGWMPDPATRPIEAGVTSVSQEACVRSQRAEEEIDRLNGSLRDGWGLLASAATGTQLNLQRRATEEQRKATEEQRQMRESQAKAAAEQSRFHTAAALVAAVVLVPGLVIGLYGANVDGLPGADTSSGRNAIFFYSVLGATITAAILRSRERTIAWMVGGVVAFVGLTVVLSAMT
jgi:hypothetical protein